LINKKNERVVKWMGLEPSSFVDLQGLLGSVEDRWEWGGQWGTEI